MRQTMRLRHMSLRTEDSYVNYVRQFIWFHGKRHPKDVKVSNVR